MTNDVRVEGLPRFHATLAVAAREVSDMRTAADENASYIGSRARATAPRRTGALASSVRNSAQSDGFTVESGLAYARRVHWGYRRYAQRPQPFIADPIWRDTPRIVENYQDDAQRILDGVKGA